MEVVGKRVGDYEDMGSPGDFLFSEPKDGLYYVCPCGCGHEGFLRFRTGRYANEHLTWIWDGNEDKPTLQPSIQRLLGCRWHGYLIAGVFKSC